jgi:hypothetical protein
VSLLRDFFEPRKRLLEQQLAIEALKKELAELRAKNASMHQGMRRCISCDYRIEAKKRQDQNGSNSE